jgi:hypothetical protein
MMPTLLDLQSDFRRFLLGGSPEQLMQLVDGVGFEPEARLSIYRNNMLVTLTAALKVTFPVVCRLVDDRFFEYAANAFIQHHPPASPCLIEYGNDFPEFLAAFAPAASLEYLPDVARLEWAIGRVLHARFSGPPIPLACLAGAQGDPAQVCLSMTEACRYAASPHPVDRIWQFNQPGMDPAEMPSGGTAVHLEIRCLDGLQLMALPQAVWTFRSKLADGTALGFAAAEALKIEPDFDLARALADLFDAGLIMGLYEAPVPTSSTRENPPTGQHLEAEMPMKSNYDSSRDTMS